MPKLGKAKAASVAAASGSFEVREDGVYHVRLVDVDGSREGPSGPYWSWEFDVVEAPYVNRKLWNNTSLSEAAAFKLKEAFEAFGVDADADTDTDDLIGEIVRATVSSRVIQQGARKGEIANQIDRLSKADPDFEADDADEDDDDDEDDDLVEEEAESKPAAHRSGSKAKAKPQEDLF
jgi:hypothetical protein